MPGSWLNTIHAVKDGKAISNRDDKANDGESIPGAVCLCQHSDREILHLIADNLDLDDKSEAIESLVIMREYPGGSWLVAMTKFQEDDDDISRTE